MKFSASTFFIALFAGFIGGLTSVLAFGVLMGLGDKGVL